jgi:hypothetical protein
MKNGTCFLTRGKPWGGRFTKQVDGSFRGRALICCNSLPAGLSPLYISLAYFTLRSMQKCLACSQHEQHSFGVIAVEGTGTALGTGTGIPIHLNNHQDSSKHRGGVLGLGANADRSLFSPPQPPPLSFFSELSQVSCVWILPVLHNCLAFFVMSTHVVV